MDAIDKKYTQHSAKEQFPLTEQPFQIIAEALWHQ